MTNSTSSNNLLAFILLFCSASVMGVANLATKTATNRAALIGGSYYAAILRQPFFYVGVLLVGVASVLWLKVMSSLGLSVAYPLFVGGTYLVVAIGSMFLFGEQLGAQRLIGVTVLFLGIVLVARS